MAVSRRALLQATGAGAVLAGAGLARAAGEDAPPAGPERPVELARDPVLHAIRRLSFGPTRALVDQVRGIGVDAWVDRQLSWQLIPDPEVERVLLHFPTLRLPAYEAASVYERSQIVGELQVAAIVRAVWSERQLYEVMVDFWTQHLNIYLGHDFGAILKTTDDRDVVRVHALGRFADLLLASAKSPAMLAYLDNWLSSGSNPNENYARELLELHTVGVNGGYTEKDIKQAALVLTGWTFKPDYTFEYRPEKHWAGPVRVMGWRHDNADRDAGLAAGESLIGYLARHPNTARFVCRKLCRRLVSDEPSAALVNSAASVYLKNDTAIAPVVKHIVASKEFRNAYGAKVRRPFELLAASLRALGVRYDVGAGSEAGGQFVHLLRNLGHAPYDWRTPDGYPDVARHWLSTQAMLLRWNMQQNLLSGVVKGMGGPSAEKLLPAGTATTTAGGFVDGLYEGLLFQKPPAADRAALLGWLGREAGATVTPDYVSAKTPGLSALVLSTATHQLR